MLMDTAGNAGGQSSVTVIRSLALGDVELKDVFRILWKELRAALLLGLTVSVVCFAKLMLIDRLYNDVTVKVALIVSSVYSSPSCWPSLSAAPSRCSQKSAGWTPRSSPVPLSRPSWTRCL